MNVLILCVGEKGVVLVGDGPGGRISWSLAMLT